MRLIARNRSFSKRSKIGRRQAPMACTRRGRLQTRGLKRMPNLRQIKLGLVVGSREFFNGAPALETRKQLIAQLDRLNVGYDILPVEATKNGAVQSREDARVYAARFRQQRDTIDGLVICLPNFGDEIAIAELVVKPDSASPSYCKPATMKSTRSTSPAAGTRSAASSRSPTISINMACRSPTRRAIPATSTVRNSPPISTGSREPAAWCAA